MEFKFYCILENFTRIPDYVLQDSSLCIILRHNNNAHQPDFIYSRIPYEDNISAYLDAECYITLVNPTDELRSFLILCGLTLDLEVSAYYLSHLILLLKFGEEFNDDFR